MLPEQSSVVLAVGEGMPDVLPLPAPEAPTLSLVDHPLEPGSNRKLMLFHAATPEDLVVAAKGLLLADAPPTGSSWSYNPMPDPPLRAACRACCVRP